MKKNKMVYVLLLILVALITGGIFAKDVFASVKVTTGTKYYMNDYGFPTTGGTFTYNKKLNGTVAYCIMHSRNVGTTYNEIDISDKDSIITGRIIEVISAKGYKAAKEYVYITAALSTYYAKYYNYSDSVDYSSYNGIGDIVSSAVSYYTTTQKKLSQVSVSASNYTMNLISGTNFISDAITISNMQTSWNGGSTTYKVTVSATDGTATICSNSSGTSCSGSSATLSGTSQKIYVKVTGASSGTDVTVKVAGSTSNTYSGGRRWQATSGKYQHLITTGKSIPVSSSTSQSKTFDVPDTTKHTITAYKVDENGDALTGSTLKIYKSSDSSTNLVTSSSGNKFVYSGSLTTVDEDDFYDNEFCIAEVSAPNGYKFGSTEKSAICITPEESSSTVCYDSDGNDTGDVELCNSSNYKYMCKADDGSGYVEMTDEGTCDFGTDDNDSSDASSAAYSVSVDSNLLTASEEEDDGSSDDGSSDDGDEGEETSTTYTKVCYKISGDSDVDEKYCTDNSEYTKVTQNGTNITVYMYNEKNSVKISKVDATGSTEVGGAKLKICTADDYDEDGMDCTTATNVDGTAMEWTSSASESAEWSGLDTGTYYIVETIPANGYKLTDVSIATEFTMKTDGTVISGDTEVEDNLIVINNELNSLSISKQDITTSDELAGATLSICVADENDDGDYEVAMDIDGECIVATLANGDKATWTSTDEPYEIEGLPAGTYYLVENTAPLGYSTTEEILFSIDYYGVVYDKNGISVDENKIVMTDSPIVNVVTGQMRMLFGLFACVGLIGVVYCYYYFRIRKNNSSGPKGINKIRGRKIKSV